MCVKQNTEGRCSLGPGRDMAVRGKGQLLDIPAPILLPRGPNFRQPLDICQHTLHGPPSHQTGVSVCLPWTVKTPTKDIPGRSETPLPPPHTFQTLQTSDPGGRCTSSPLEKEEEERRKRRGLCWDKCMRRWANPLTCPRKHPTWCSEQGGRTGSQAELHPHPQA